MLTNRIRMRHLKCFRAVAQLGSVTRAAEALGTVQPSVSRTLRELEAEIGNPLFDRSGSGLTLNEAGRVLMAYVSNGLGQIERGLQALGGERSGEAVVAYVLPNVVRTIMPGATKRFKTYAPHIDITLLPTASGGFHTYISEGKVDFGFGRLLSAEQMDAMSFEHLFDEELCFFVRAAHPLAAATRPALDDFEACTVVLPTRGTVIRDELDRFVISKGHSGFANTIETLSFEFSRNLMLTSDAIVFQPFGALRRELDAGLVVPLPIGKGEMNGAVGITVPAGRGLSPSAQLLVQMIREEARQQGLISGGL